MLKQILSIGCIFICTIMVDSASSKTAKSIDNSRKSQREGDTGEERDFSETELFATEFPSFSNRTSLNMLEDINAKVWRILPVIDIPRSWVIKYCVRYTEIYEDVEKAAMQCRHDGTDWDCAFIELGGGRDDFNMGKIVSSFHDLSDQGLRLKLLRGAEICGKLWQRYKRVQDKRLIRMQLNVKNRRKRFLGKKKSVRKNSKKRKENGRDEESKKARQAVKEMRDIRRSLMNKIRELESKRSLSSKEEKELDQLHLTVATKSRMNLEEYPLAEDRTELSRLQEIGSCLSRQVAKACESTVLNAVQKLI